MKVLDLFSGIGGFSLGLERAGMETVAFCEIDPFCRKVLAKHWPNTTIYEDVTKLDGRKYAAKVDVICGGFPCQDVSYAGKGAGLAGERSGLWREFYRLICEIRPSYIIVENVSALLNRGMGDVIGDLAQVGYDAEWHCIPASYFGAPHIRDRVWVIAYPNKDGCDSSPKFAGRIRAQRQSCVWEPFRAVDFAVRVQELTEICGNDDGIPEELGAYGNSVVPQIPEAIGKSIMQDYP